MTNIQDHVANRVITHLNGKSIACIQGDRVYGSNVIFYTGGTRNEIIQHIADIILDDIYLHGYHCYYIKEFKDKEPSRELLIKILTNDITSFNKSCAYKTYFWISVQTKDEWYKHLIYIAAGTKSQIRFTYCDLGTGKTEKYNCNSAHTIEQRFL